MAQFVKLSRDEIKALVEAPTAKKSAKVSKSIRFSPEEINAIHAAARKTQQTFSQFVRHAVMAFIYQNDLVRDENDENA